MELVQGATLICEGSCRLTSLERQERLNDLQELLQVRVGSNGNLLWEASVLLGRKKGGVRVARKDDRGVTEGREDVREVFQQRGSGAKRKLSRCGRNQMGNEPILALPEGADDFVVYYDARSKDLEACLEKGRSEFDFEAKYHLGKANVDVIPWSRRRSEARTLAIDEALTLEDIIYFLEADSLLGVIVEVEYQGSSGLLLQPKLPE
ncbi:hypothetical protein Tco_1156872 [Tanacetum coccineum]